MKFIMTRKIKKTLTTSGDLSCFAEGSRFVILNVVETSCHVERSATSRMYL